METKKFCLGTITDTEKLFFCCKLRNGVFIWGILSIVFCLVVLITNVSSDFCVKIVSAENVPSLYWTISVCSTIHLILSVLLCVGVLKRIHYMILPYVIVTGLYLIPVLFTGLIGVLAAIPIFGPIYIWWCIGVYYFKILEEPVDSTFDCRLVISQTN